LFEAPDFQSRALAVGHDEDPPSEVRRPDVDSPQRYGSGSIVSIPKLLHHARKPAFRTGGHVLDDDPARADFGDDPEEVEEREAASGFDAEAGALSGGTDVLTREAAAKHIDSWWMLDRGDISEPLHVGKVMRQDPLRERRDFTLPQDLRWDPRFDERGEDADL
jgi:hypothetical protein